MKNVLSIAMLIILAAFISVSCKSTPDAPEEPVTEERPAVVTPAPVSNEALAEPKTRAEAARQRAMDFESPAYFPSDWENLEAQFAAVGEMPASNNSEIQQAVAALNSAADSYDELFGRTIPLYAQAREDEILSTRETLIHTGFTRYFPEYLKIADDLALAALDQYEAGDFYTARDTAKSALTEYETLLLGARVFLARQEIIDRGFVDYDRDNFLRADDVTKSALDNYEAGNKEDAIANAEEALLRFNIVLANGWTAFTADRRAAAVAEREQALAERVNIASREIFREAEAFFNQAEANLASENFHDAAMHYIDAEAMYMIGRKDTEERRQRAEAAIRMAEEKIEESSETAQEAERIIGEVNIEGGIR